MSNPIWGGSGSGPAKFHWDTGVRGAALSRHLHPELLQHPREGRRWERGWQKAGLPWCSVCPCMVHNGITQLLVGMSFPLCSPCIVWAICPSAGHRTQIPPVPPLCSGSKGSQISCKLCRVRSQQAAPELGVMRWNLIPSSPGEQSCVCSAVKPWGSRHHSQPPGHWLFVKLFVQVREQRLRARFPVWLPSPPPCVVPTSFLLTGVYVLGASLIRSEVFQSRACRTHRMFCLLFAITWCLSLWSAAVTSSRVNPEWASEWMCLRDSWFEGKVAIPADSDQFFCHLSSKAEIKTYEGNMSKLYHDESFLFKHMGTFSKCRNTAIPTDLLMITCMQVICHFPN